MPYRKTITISEKYSLPYKVLLEQLYREEKLSAGAIVDKLLRDTGISITSQQIHHDLRLLGLSRSKSEAFKLAIKTGRKSYAHLRKPVKSRTYRKGLSLGLRYKVLKRDNFRCVLCGLGTQETILTIDHIIPVLRGGTNEIRNLRVLCRDCNTGKMISENEK